MFCNYLLLNNPEKNKLDSLIDMSKNFKSKYEFRKTNSKFTFDSKSRLRGSNEMKMETINDINPNSSHLIEQP